MSSLNKPLIIISVLLVAVAVAFVLSWQKMAQSVSYADLTRALTTTTATFGTLIGVITAGLMFTQGAFSRLASELNEKSPTYLTEVLSLEKIQSIVARLVALRKTFTQSATTTTVKEERDLYTRIATKASDLFVDHNHPRWIGHNGARMIENMDAAGIERTWLLSWEVPESELDSYYSSVLIPRGAGIPFRDVLDVVERYPDRFICGTTVDPHDPHALDRLKAAVDIHRVRVFGEFKRRMRYDDPDAIRVFHYCGEVGLPVILHLDVTLPRHGVPNSWQWWYGGGLENMEAPLRLFPKTQFLGHAPGFWKG